MAATAWSRRSMKSFLPNAALFLFSCLVALGGIELALRLWGPDVLAMGNQYVFYKYDPVLGWDNLPNMRGQFSRLEFSYPVSINSQGMRDAEIKERRPDEFRVAVLGDSFVWGVGVAYGERFTEVVEARNPHINVLNFGVLWILSHSVSASARQGLRSSTGLRGGDDLPRQ